MPIVSRKTATLLTRWEHIICVLRHLAKNFKLQIGTYNAAVLAARHRIPFIVVAPITTVDLDIPDGKQYVSFP